MSVVNDFFNDPVEYAHYREREMICWERVSKQEGFLKKGWEEGWREGWKEGWKEGWREGLKKGWEEAINKVVSRTSVARAAYLFDMSEAEIREIVARVGSSAS